MTRTTSTSNKASATEFQEGLEAAQRRQNSDKEVTILTSKLEELKKTAAESNKLRRELTACDKKIAKLEKTINTLETRLNADGTASTVLTDSIKEKEKVIKELQLLVTQLQGALRKNGTVHESELNRDLVEQTFYAAKIYLFRNVKFFEDDEDAEEKTKMLVKYLPKGVESLGDLSVEEYATMYKQAANQGIQAAKQSVQAEGKKAAGGTYIFFVFGYIVLANLRNFVFEFTDYIFVILLRALFSFVFYQKVWMKKHGTLPTREEIWDTLQMTEAALELPANQVRKELYLWYYDVWLPAILPKEFWKEDIRHYKLLTDTVEIAGQQKVLVTVASEAFGLLMWENCQDKWVNYYKLKANDEKAVVPTGKHPDAASHTAKWSDGNSGQVKYGGWKDEAYEVFEKLKKEVKDWRKVDEENGKAGQRLGLKFMRDAHKKKGATAQDDKKKTSRKKKTSPVVAAPKRRKLTVEDE